MKHHIGVAAIRRGERNPQKIRWQTCHSLPLSLSLCCFSPSYKTIITHNANINFYLRETGSAVTHSPRIHFDCGAHSNSPIAKMQIVRRKTQGQSHTIANTTLTHIGTRVLGAGPFHFYTKSGISAMEYGIKYKYIQRAQHAFECWLLASFSL